jgi:hypothetical protein
MAGRARFNPITHALSRAKLRKSPPVTLATRATGGQETASKPPPPPRGPESRQGRQRPAQGRETGAREGVRPRHTRKECSPPTLFRSHAAHGHAAFSKDGR